jgi:nitrous oxide reductase accessory protein NosL
MKKIATSLLVFFVSISFASPDFEDWDKEAFTKPVLVQTGTQKHWCPICGMSIKKFYKTSHAAILPDGTKRQYCSIRCLAVDNKQHHIDKKTIKTVDNTSEKLIGAYSAFYVVDSDIPGTMSKVSKLAFSKKEDAKVFIEEYDGHIVSFDKAFKMANTSLKTDIAMIQKKKKKKVYPIGKKIFKKYCHQEINLDSYTQINELKADIKNNNLCDKLTPRQLQVTALYLWEVVHAKTLLSSHKTIHVTKDEKCPICGMYVYKYPRWAAQIFLDDTKHLTFDGVKDLMKYYLENKRNKKIIVTDYYSQYAIDATKAYYVIGSDSYGPMGHELIPFLHLSDAKIFKEDHRGTKILKFSEITKEEIEKLD